MTTLFRDPDNPLIARVDPVSLNLFFRVHTKPSQATGLQERCLAQLETGNFLGRVAQQPNQPKEA